jgi:hypothetical protein
VVAGADGAVDAGADGALDVGGIAGGPGAAIADVPPLAGGVDAPAPGAAVTPGDVAVDGGVVVTTVGGDGVTGDVDGAAVDDVVDPAAAAAGGATTAGAGAGDAGRVPYRLANAPSVASPVPIPKAVISCGVRPSRPSTTTRALALTVLSSRAVAMAT